MIDFYRELIESEDCEVEFVFSNDVKTILDYDNDGLTCDIHTREKTRAKTLCAKRKLAKKPPLCKRRGTASAVEELCHKPRTFKKVTYRTNNSSVTS